MRSELLIIGRGRAPRWPTHDGHTTHPRRPAGAGPSTGPRRPRPLGQLTPRYASWIDGSASSSAPGPERVTSPVSST